MALFTPTFQAALSTSPQVFEVVDIDFPAGAGGTLRFTEDLPSGGARSAEGRLLASKRGNLKTGVTPRVSDFTRQQTSLALADTDRKISRIFAGRYDCRRSPVVIKWGLPTVDETYWPTMFTGVVDDWTADGTSVIVIASTDDLPMRSAVPHRQILKGWAKNCPAKNLGVYLPIVIGIHDAGNGLTNEGMVRPVMYDSSSWRYIVSLGIVKAVDAVYKNGTLLALTTNYTVQQEWLGGAYCTTIKLAASATVDDVVTANVQGVTTDGTASGTVITEPTEQLKWALNNLVYNDWNGKATLYTNAPVEAGSFARTAAYLTQMGAEAGIVIGGTTSPTTGAALANIWLRSRPTVRMYWSALGKIGLVPFDHKWTPYSSNYDFDGLDIADSFRFKNQTDGVVSTVASERIYSHSESKYLNALQVQDLTKYDVEKVTEKFSLEWGVRRYS